MVFGTHTDIACRLQRHTMTSVTIPTSTGPLHGGYPSVLEELSSSEPEFESSRSSKRPLCLTPSSSDSCKKRRKQSTPIRIFNSEPEVKNGGAVGSTNVKLTEEEEEEDDEEEEEEHKCNLCQLKLGSDNQLQSHIACEHQQVEVKKDPDDDASSAVFVDAPLCLTMGGRPEMPWNTELQTKDWAPNVYNSSNPVFMAMSQFNQPDNIQMKPARIFNPDAYCEMCNKEFCNKYFLKTHKANKHGIYTDTAPSEPQMTVNYGASLNLKLPIPVPSVDNLLRNDTNTPTISVINPYNIPFSSTFSANKLPKRPSVLQNNEVNNIQCSVSLRTCNGPSSNESDKYISEDPVDECSTSTNLPITESTSAKNEFDNESPSRELDLSNRLRRIGVMNPKAFCEICNKEYCNKYFLRTHKMKRHGIYIPDDRDSKMDGPINSSWPSSTVQTSPLNLIVTESSSTVFDRKTTSPNDISCDLCGIKFQNANLAQLHNYTVHGKISKETEQDNPEVNFESIVGESKVSNNDKSINSQTETISEDLQKLQTMILQLNDLDMTKSSSNICNYCNREFENRFYLHAHMVTDHGMLMEENSDAEKNGESENSNNNTLCDICGKDLQNAEDMKKHVMESHSNIHTSSIESSNKDDFSNENLSPDKRIFSAPERRLSVNVTPTSSYCEICNKELCNKYFMKTHMQRMHGIEIENGAQIGGVVCDICNKELCSKYFLRVHKHNTHGIVEYGASLLQSNRKSESEPSSQPPEPESALKPSDLADLSHRYFTHFTEVCPICSRRFRSTKWLKAHLVSDHGQAGVEKWAELDQQLQQTLHQHSKTKAIKTERITSPGIKLSNGNQDLAPKNFTINNVLSTVFGPEDPAGVKSYQCSYCPFTSPLLPLLFIHERIHTINENVPLKCPVCPQSFLERELFQRHIYSHHPFFPSPPVFDEQNKKPTSPQEILEQKEEEEEQGEAAKSNNEEVKIEASESPPNPNPKISVANLPMEISHQSLKDLAKKVQLPALYALPHKVNDLAQDDDSPGYVMQPFLLEDSASDRTVVPSVVFLPVIQKQPAPLTVTFTLTPA